MPNASLPGRIGKITRKAGLPAALPSTAPLASLSGGTYGSRERFGSAFAYDAAVPRSQEMMGWLPWLRSSDSEINFDRNMMVARARDLIRNDGWATGSINRIADSAIGAQFFPIPTPNWRALQRSLGPAYDDTWAREATSALVSEWRLWADDTSRYCDATRRMTVTQIFRQAFRTKMIEGDALAMLPWQPDRVGPGGARYATCVQLIDPDRLSNPNFGPDQAQLRGGVAIDGVGAAVGYHICRGHQSDMYLTSDSMIWDFFQRELPWGRPFVVHDFDGDRASQHRGTGILTSVLSRFRMLHKYDDTSLQAAIIRAILGFFITSSQDEDSVTAALDPSNSLVDRVTAAANSDILREGRNEGLPITMNGARVPVMGPGEKIQAVGGEGHADDYDVFESAVIRSISSATGQASEEISNNFKGLNYSSFRGSLLQAFRTLIRRRRDFQWGFADPIYSAFTEEAFDLIASDVMPRGYTHDAFIENRAAFCATEWIGPGRGWVDPVKERQGEVLGLDAGFGTLKDTCANISGMWWEDALLQRKHEVETMKKYGLPLPDWTGAVSATPANVVDQKPVAQ